MHTLSTLFGIPKANAASGIQLGGDVISGAQAGIAEAAESLGATVNNQYLITLLVMFIGIAAAVGLVMYAVKKHRGTVGGGYYGSREWMLADTERKIAVNDHKLRDYKDKMQARSRTGKYAGW